MRETESVRVGGEADRARYLAMAPLQRAESAQELANEILEHYDRARALIAALVTELADVADEEAKPATQLATILEDWVNQPEHVAQEARLFACLHSEVIAQHAARETAHG
jgi:DNA repair protein RadC